jgi:hypothetical protein
MDDKPYEALVQIFYHTAGQKVEAYVLSLMGWNLGA